jgi:branched-chain amino acid aminotransferase
MNGQFMPCENAQMHIVNHGLHYATSVFEGIRSYNGHIFKGKEHFERFKKSANYLNFDISFGVEEMMGITQTLITKNALQESYIRPIAWCGTNSMKISTVGMDVHTAICAWHWETVPYSDKGLSLCISPWRRPDPRSAPTQSKAGGLYMISSLSKADAQKRGFDDALMLDCEDNVAESTVTNIFFIKNGVLHTPTPKSFLNGITRLTVIDIAQKLGIKVIEESISLDQLKDFQGCFLTGTALEILPVQTITGEGETLEFNDRIIVGKIYEEFYKITRIS